MTAPVGAFLRLSRPHFLLGGALAFALGAATASGIDTTTYVVGQLMVSAAQLTAHYVNEYADVEADRAITARTWFSGGSGVLVAGTLAPVIALRAAWVSSLLAIGFAAVLGASAPLAAGLGVASLAVSWAYSMPPLRLLQTGFGELATSLVVAGVVPVIGVLTQESAVPAELWCGIAPLVLIHMAMMLAFELPDLASDAASGKRVLAVRIGPTRTLAVIVLLYLLAAALMLAAVASGTIGRPAGLGTILVLVVALVTPYAVRAERWSWLTTNAVAAFVAATLALLLSWL